VILELVIELRGCIEYSQISPTSETDKNDPASAVFTIPRNLLDRPSKPTGSSVHSASLYSSSKTEGETSAYREELNVLNQQ